MPKKKIFITGGNGFIGSHVVGRLVALGETPHLLLRKNSNRDRLANNLQQIKIFEGDLKDKDVVEAVVKEVQPTHIIHLASTGVYSYTDVSYENTQLMLAANLIGTMNLLYAAKHVHCELVLNTGSCYEYGSNDAPFKEDDALDPSNTYGVIKSAATQYAKVFGNISMVPIVTVRPFTVYGPGEDPRRFISTTIKRCLAGQNPVLTAQEIVRDYIYIDDVVDVYIKIINEGLPRNEIVNIATGKGTSLVDVAKLIMQLTNRHELTVEIGAFPKRPGEVVSLVGDEKKLVRLLGWKARHSLQEGLEKTIASIGK